MSNQHSISQETQNNSQKIQASESSNLNLEGLNISGRFTSLKQYFEFCFQQFAVKSYLGSRQSNNTQNENFIFKSYQQVSQAVQQIICSYDCFNLSSKNEENVRLLMNYGVNNEQERMLEIAALMMGVTVIPLSRKNQDFLLHILRSTKCNTISMQSQDLEMLIKLKQENTQDLDFPIQVICTDEEQVDASLLQLSKQFSISILSFSQLLSQQQKKENEIDIHQETLAMILYIAGKNGQPEGVMLSHGNLLSAVTIALKQEELIFRSYYLSSSKDDQLCMISYIPFGCIYEQIFFLLSTYCGGKIGFYCGLKENLIQDISCLQPTIIPAFPKFLKKLQQNIQHKLSKISGAKQWFFELGFLAKQYKFRTQGDSSHFFWDSYMFHKFRNYFGGKVRQIISCSAALDFETKEFICIMLSLGLIENYGKTETTGLIGYSNSQSKSYLFYQDTEVRLKDFPELYNHQGETGQQSASNCLGEIQIRGAQLFKGYYKNNSLTQEVLQNGWLSTQDIGSIKEEGLKIVQTTKNFFKLTNGEYINPEKIEEVYNQSPFIDQSFVYGDSNKDYIVALIVTNFEQVQIWKNKCIKDLKLDFHQLCQTEELQNEMLEQIQKYGKQNKLKACEIARVIHIQSEPFMTENEVLDKNLRINRQVIAKKYDEVINSLYSF